MKQLIIINFEEIYLKGENQHIFSKKLRENLKSKLTPWKDYLHFARKHGGSIFIEVTRTLPGEEWEKIREIIAETPGISQFYLVRSVPTDIEAMKKAALETAEKKLSPGESFRITARRLKKSLPYTSQDIAREIGAAIVEKFGNPVDLHDPDWNLHIKIRPEQTFLYDEIIRGQGGLPAGTAGRAIALLSGGIDSPVAARLMLNRGLELVAVHFHSVPKTSPKSIEKVKLLAGKLARVQGKIKLYLIPVLDIQQAIARHTDSKLRLVLLRRIMLRIAEKLLDRENAKVIITGDSLGQVASQTLENMIAIDNAVASLVLRPLAGLDKKTIISLARRFGTYDISVLPHDDACSLFTPKRPETKAYLPYVLEQCAKLPVGQLIEEALDKAETEIISTFEPETGL